MMTRLLTLALAIILWTHGAQAQTLKTPAKQAIIVDYETGAVLFAKNADQQMPTSSMSKVMTIYVVFQALKDGIISLSDTFKVSEKAWRKGGSKMFVEVGKNVKIEDLIRGVIIQSGNDATIVLAEGLLGSEDAFAETMNMVARDLGMKNSNFKNASGWPDPDHYSTAEDLAILAKALIQNFPEYYAYYGEKEFTYNDIKQANRNPLLHQNIGADGIKTGHTEAGGYGLIGSGVINGRRVIMVENGLDNTTARAQEAKKLLNWGLQNFKNETIVSAGDTLENASLILGEAQSVPLVLNEDLRLTLRRNQDKNVKIDIQYDAPLQAPIQKGDKIGALTIKRPGMEETTRPLYAGTDVEKLGLFASVIAKAKLLIAGRS